jgi:parallel beta-helix repeat protein
MPEAPKNLAIINASSFGSAGVVISSNNNTVTGCSIGTDWNNSLGEGNYYGVSLNNTSGNIIGGNQNNLAGNVISGNQSFGIWLYSANRNMIAGNIVGLSSDQSVKIPNNIGIYLSFSSNNQIGLAAIGYNNIISGNQQDGISLDSSYNVVVNNYIGLTKNNIPLGNNVRGIYIKSGGHHTTIGGSLPMEKNIISGNSSCEVLIEANNVQLINNFIGTNIEGTNALAGAPEKVYIYYPLADSCTIGTKGTGQGNLIVGGNYGIHINSVSGWNGIFGNTICGFSSKGICLEGSANNNKLVPKILFANLTSVWGTSQAGDFIEVFKAENKPGGYGGALLYLGNCTTDSNGFWSISTSGLAEGEYICTTATDSNNNTSEFSLNALVMNATPTLTSTMTSTPTATPTATQSSTCSSTKTCSPTMTATRSATSTSTATFTTSGTPTLTWTITPTLSPTSSRSPTASFTIPITSIPTSSSTPTINETPTFTTTFTINPTCTATFTNVIVNNLDLGDKLILAYPNPSKGLVHFAWVESGSEKVKINVFNLSGERIATLIAATPGQSVDWNAAGVAPGIYIYRVTLTVNGTERQLPAQKLAIIKP